MYCSFSASSGLSEAVRRARICFEILLQLPFLLIFSTFIDANMALMSQFRPSSYALCLTLLGAGCICQAVGVVLELIPNVAIMSAEGFVKYAARRYNLEFGRLKVKFDVTLVSLAIVLSLYFSGRIEGFVKVRSPQHSRQVI